MITLSVQEAQAQLPELIEQLSSGTGIIITRDETPVAQLVPLAGKPQPQFGSCKGKLLILAEDDEHLADFREYMP